MHTRRAKLVLAFLCCCICGCIQGSPFYEEREGLGLSNLEYTSHHVSGPGYPGASAIDTMYKNFGITTGRTDRWTKVAIPKSDYENLWSNEAKFVRTEGHRAVQTADGAQLDRLQANEALLPSQWGSSPFRRPAWWRLPQAPTQVEITAWEWSDAESETDTAYADSGEYWLYDMERETLWIWFWRERY